MVGVLGGCSQQLSEARSLEQGGDVQGAVAAYTAILQEHPGDLDALRGAASLLWVVQRYDEALPFQEQVVALDAHEVQIRVELGFNYLNHQQRANDAARVLKEAAELEPSGKHWTFAGQALREAGDLLAAEAALRKAIDRDATYTRAYDQLAELLESMGRAAEAAAVRAQAAAGASS